jgi:hypothetical protein
LLASRRQGATDWLYQWCYLTATKNISKKAWIIDNPGFLLIFLSQAVKLDWLLKFFN